MVEIEKAKFTITYSRNCDGGLQEFSTAAKCVRDVFPDCTIVSERTNNYPIKVVITVKMEDDDDKKVVWSGKQENLFEKYSKRRAKCIQRIKSKLVELREQNSSSTSHCSSPVSGESERNEC